MLRSCYESEWQFYTNPGVPAQPVRWYFVPPGTPVYDGPSAFSPSVWFANSGIVGTGLGELDESGPVWSPGTAPAVEFTLRPLGSPQAFVDGFPSPPVPPVPCAVEGIPTAVTVQ